MLPPYVPSTPFHALNRLPGANSVLAGCTLDIPQHDRQRNTSHSQMKAYDKQEGEIVHIKKHASFIASAGTAKSKQKIIDKMEAAGLVEKVETQRSLRFNFEDMSKLPPPILAFNDVAFSYSGKENYLYQSVYFGTEFGLLPPLTPSKYSNLSHESLPYEKSLIEYFDALYTEKYPNEDVMAQRAQLGRFGLSGQHQTSPIRQLSDGLRDRVVFAPLAMEHPHIHLLAEPTNHLDMTSIDALARTIKNLVSQVAEELWVVKNKKIGNLTREDITIADLLSYSRA
ncbi:hypothetical protein BD410DRAFT_798584 [Rickenella mellea]|uniref:Uncharacterized protein n=1 Tax=Rickenella mellea TaxID=50990 RepID=A0A4R5XG73_9AGAM|nr:hypothetical protein BD410DRAFT_798584 [Rickenella mellea]